MIDSRMREGKSSVAGERTSPDIHSIIINPTPVA
jgi:hypothetical protein